ncbi:MAG: repeat-associated core domain protein, partial [Chloroflexi bacterium]|nr:repeat-associated core domain protein [Chloroflexota bacterium]
YLGSSTPYELIRQYASAVTCGGVNSATCKYFYIVDGRGNVVALTEATGNVVDRYSYDVWGVPSISLEAVPQPLLYAGYWYDRELATPGETLGWYWLSARPQAPLACVRI